MDTLLLDPNTWDLVLNASNNIALASAVYPRAPLKAAAYAQAQDAACAIRLFQGELTYDIDQGVPYFQQILGKLPPVPLMKARFTQAAMRVPGVTSAQVFFSSFDNRELLGQVQITNDSGRTAAANF